MIKCMLTEGSLFAISGIRYGESVVQNMNSTLNSYVERWFYEIKKS